MRERRLLGYVIRWQDFAEEDSVPVGDLRAFLDDAAAGLTDPLVDFSAHGGSDDVAIRVEVWGRPE